MEIPSEVLYIIERLNANGHEAYMVGGCVRDHLMGLCPKDYDITTSATPDMVRGYFKRSFDTGVKHGTLTVLVNDKQFEVTTFRLDGEYKDNRRPDSVEFTEDITEDLSRRDFTMNAIAYHSSVGFVDPFGGIEDIKNKTIRGVGDPNRRFQEDALRMLRALRFSAQLDFGIEEGTREAIRTNAGLISLISAERVRDELCRLLLSEHPEKFSAVAELGLGPYIYSQSDYLQGSALKTLPFIKICQPVLDLRLALFLRFMSEAEAETFLRTLKSNNKIIKNVTLLVRIFEQETDFLNASEPYTNTRYEIKKRLCEYGVEPMQNALYLEKICNREKAEWLNGISHDIVDITARGECFNLGSLRIDGRRLKALGIGDGREIGQELRRLLDRVMLEPELNDPRQLTQLVLCHNRR